MGRVFTNGLGDWGSILGLVIPKTQKWYLMPPYLTLNIIRYESRVKWNNPGNRVAPSPTPQCSSYWKGSPRVTLDFGCQLYLFLYLKTMFLQQCPACLVRLTKKQERTHKWCTLMDPHTWPCKSRTTSTNIHSATMWGYRMLSRRPAWCDER